MKKTRRYFLVFYSILVAVTLTLLIVVLIFRDQVAFYLAGFDYSMRKIISPAAFKNYEIIQNWRLVLIGLTFLSGVTCFGVSRIMEKTEYPALYTVGKFSGIITAILMIIIFMMAVILPHRVF